jgi:hypothetical protein
MPLTAILGPLPLQHYHHHTMSTEQDQSRADFEALGRNKGWNLTAIMLTSMPPQFERYADATTQARWEDWQAPSLTTAQLQKLDRWLTAPSDLDGDQPMPRE